MKLTAEILAGLETMGMLHDLGQSIADVDEEQRPDAVRLTALASDWIKATAKSARGMAIRLQDRGTSLRDISHALRAAGYKSPWGRETWSASSVSHLLRTPL